MNKQEAISFLQLVAKQIDGLSEAQYQQLLAKKARLQYIETNIPAENSQPLVTKLQSAASLPEIKRILKDVKKDQLLEICQQLPIEGKSSETKMNLCNKIISHFFTIDDSTDNWQEIKDRLKQIDDVEQAKVLIASHPSLKTKASLLELAKNLDVYVKQKLKKEEIQARIAESYVGSKLRAKGIRETLV